MERKKQRISDLFYDNRFLMVFSVLFALIAWLIVATEFAETQTTISDVEVEIDCSNINSSFPGLEPFIDEKPTVDVTISGKRYIVESDNIKDDILVVADTSAVNYPGSYALTLTVTSKSVRPEYEFVSIYPQVTEKITFDYSRELERKIEPDLIFKEKAVRDGYQMGELLVSDLSTVKVSGPETKINKVVRVVARAELDGDLHQSTSVVATLLPVDKDNVFVPGVEVKRTSDKVSVTIPVYSVQNPTVTCSFSNIPSEYIDNIPFEYSVEPSSATFGIFDENEEKESIELATKIDFTMLHPGENIFTVPVNANEFPGAILLDETITEFVVTVNVPDVSSMTFEEVPENFKYDNLPNDVNIEFSGFQFAELTVIGPSDKLSQLNKDNIVLIADFGEYDNFDLDSVVVPLRLYDGYCWSVGEYYATFNIL